MVREPANQFRGHHSSGIRDPFGHEWGLGREIGKSALEEIGRRFNALWG